MECKKSMKAIYYYSILLKLSSRLNPIILCISLGTMATNSFGYAYAVKNMTKSNLSAIINLGNTKSSFDIPSNSLKYESLGISCAYSIQVTANDGELLGQTLTYSFEKNYCRNVILVVENNRKVLQAQALYY